MRRSSRRSPGFTIIELLVVMVIVGAVTGALFVNLNRNRNRAQLREAALQVVTDLNRARAKAQQTSSGSVVQLASQTGATGYTTQWAGASSATSRTLVNGVIAETVSPATAAGRTISYAAPYAEIDGVGNVWKFTGKGSIDPLYVKVVGVTGKVILSATQD